MRKLLFITIALIFLMGVAHIALTAATYGSFTIDAMWFAGSGVALILLSMLIFVLVVGEVKKSLYFVGHFANLLGVTLVALILSIVFASHIFVLFVLLLLQMIIFILYHLKKPIIFRYFRCNLSTYSTVSFSNKGRFPPLGP